MFAYSAVSMNQKQLFPADEKRLIDRIVAGDQRAISELYDRYAAALFGLILRILPDEEAAEGVLQNVFLKTWFDASDLKDSGGRIFIHLMRLSRNFAMKAAVTSTEKHDSEIRKRPESVSMRVNSLTPAEEKDSRTSYQVLHLVFSKGYNVAQAAGELGCTADEIKRKIRTELQEFRTAMIHE